ncbi:MAG: YraN family protein [Candidatus Dojkabacteria bacterium]
MNLQNPVSNREKGRDSEDLALKFLQKKGFTLIEKNFTVKGGEIDLIMSFDGFYVFIEVKSLNVFSPFSVYQSLTKRKKYFLRKTIDKWLLKNNLKSEPWRVDFVAIQTYPNKTSKIEHFEYIQI